MRASRASLHGGKRGWRQQLAADVLDELAILRRLAKYEPFNTIELRQQIVADVDGALLDLASAEAQQAIAAERLKLANDELAQAREAARRLKKPEARLAELDQIEGARS